MAAGGEVMSQTTNYLKAQLHRAQNQDEKTVVVSTLDLAEILQQIESAIGRERVEFAGQHFGWCRPNDVRSMCNGTRFYITVRRKKNDDYNTSVCFASLPEVVKTDAAEVEA